MVTFQRAGDPRFIDPDLALREFQHHAGLRTCCYDEPNIPWGVTIPFGVFSVYLRLDSEIGVWKGQAILRIDCRQFLKVE